MCAVRTCPKGKATRRWGVKRVRGTAVPCTTIERPGLSAKLTDGRGNCRAHRSAHHMHLPAPPTLPSVRLRLTAPSASGRSFSAVPAAGGLDDPGLSGESTKTGLLHPHQTQRPVFIFNSHKPLPLVPAKQVRSGGAGVEPLPSPLLHTSPHHSIPSGAYAARSTPSGASQGAPVS